MMTVFSLKDIWDPIWERLTSKVLLILIPGKLWSAGSVKTAMLYAITNVLNVSGGEGCPGDSEITCDMILARIDVY